MVLLFRPSALTLFSFSGLFANKLLNMILKYTIRQPRPSNPWKKGYGMPSDHAQFMGFVACFAVLAYEFLHQERPHIHLPPKISLLIPLVVALFVCYSRLAIGVHSFEQVYLGFVFGALFALIWYYLGVILYPTYGARLDSILHRKSD